jgi:hypothetical protein
MITALEILNEIYKDVQTDYFDSYDKQEVLTLIDELTIKLKNLKN